MKIDTLKKQVHDMQNKIQEACSDLDYAQNNLDDLESYASSGSDNISDCRTSISILDDELEVIKVDLDNLEGFDVDKVRQEVAEELIFKLTNRFGKFIKEALASDLYPDELKKAPAKKSTETDNQ
tara:strand:- start:684 stop:1058 length:375 start_codon:yes stop_codon:yes gene_type:complete